MAEVEEAEDETTTVTITVEVEPTESIPSQSDVFVFHFVKTLHYWVTGFAVLLILGVLFSLIGIV